MALALVTAWAPAEAGSDRVKVAGLFDFLFTPQQQQQQPSAQAPDAPRRKKRAKRHTVRDRDFERPQYRRPTYARPATAPTAPAAPKVEPTFHVAVLGDNLGMQLDQGLQDAFSEQPEVGFAHKAKEGSGLARDDYFDWDKASRDLLAAKDPAPKDRIDIAVILLGSNDAQALHQGPNTYDLNSDKWKEVYAERVASIAQAFKDRKIPLVWVGIPVMRNPRLASQAAIINDIIRTEATKSGATYIDSWQAFVNDQGDYDDYGPDATGQRVKLRAADGVHFTKAGARKMALFVEPDIRRAMENSKPAVEEVAKTPNGSIADAELPPQPTVDINDLILRELAAAGKPGSIKPGASKPQIEARLPAPAPALEPVLPLKPAAGPVMPLTAAPTSPGGELAQPIVRTAATAKISNILERALVLGLPVDSRPGRSDDFRWPRR